MGKGRFLPYPASAEHAGVHKVGTHQSHLDPVLLRRLDFVAQGLMETDGSELAGAVILKKENMTMFLFRFTNTPFFLVFCNPMTEKMIKTDR